MPKYRNALPQLSDDFFLTDGGIETTLIFHNGLDLPCFAAFDLLKHADGEGAGADDVGCGAGGPAHEALGVSGGQGGGSDRVQRVEPPDDRATSTVAKEGDSAWKREGHGQGRDRSGVRRPRAPHSDPAARARRTTAAQCVERDPHDHRLVLNHAPCVSPGSLRTRRARDLSRRLPRRCPVHDELATWRRCARHERHRGRAHGARPRRPRSRAALVAARRHVPGRG